LTSSTETSLSLVVPFSGEVLSLDDASGCLRVLSEIRDLESQLRQAKSALTEALAAEFSRQGTKTLELNGVKASLGGGSETVWDIEILNELGELGLPEERLDELITTEVSYRVNASVAKAIAAANEGYGEIIERAKSVIPKAAYVKVSRGQSF